MERWNSYAELVSASGVEDDKSIQTSWNSSDLLLSTEGGNFCDKTQIICDKVQENKKTSQDNLWLCSVNSYQQYKDKIWFYTSDYSDILAMNWISWFLEEFVPFFEQFNNTMMEIRSKSANIKPIFDLWFVPKNTEFAFSLNPQELIDKYEKWTSSLKDRINAINALLEKCYKVWLRFLPLLPVKNYEKIYIEFVDYIKKNISIEKITSIFVSGLFYTKDDYKKILRKKPGLDILYFLKEEDKYFVRESKKARKFFYNLFSQLGKQCFICLDKK